MPDPARPLSPREAEEYLLGLELFGMRFGLDRMHKLMTALGMPQRRFASIHVVGTNGKSSTVRMIAAVLERHGLRTGSYTSPHLRSFAERVEVGERPLSPEEFAAGVARAKRAAELVDRTLPEDDRVTQFEALTAAAYHLLATHGVDVAVVEAGLGGRYDATNVIPSSVQVLTGIGLEHTKWLGPTLRDIAGEKLDVVRSHGVLVTPPGLPPEVEEVVASVCNERVARRAMAAPLTAAPLRVHGEFQRRNFAVAEAAAEAFLARARGGLVGFAPHSEDKVTSAPSGAPSQLDPAAVRKAAAETVLPGRLEVVSTEPLTIHDGAHNPAGAKALAESLPALLEGRPLTAVIAVLDDKDAASMLAELAPLCETAVLTRSANPRSLPPATLETLWRKAGGGSAELAPGPEAAVARARELAGSSGAVLVTGSIYLVADLVRDPGAAGASTL